MYHRLAVRVRGSAEEWCEHEAGFGGARTGLYAPGALILYAALGSSRYLVTGPMAATAALSTATVAGLVPVGDNRKRSDLRRPWSARSHGRP